MIDMRDIRQSHDLLRLAGRDTRLRRVASSGGGEHAGPCPFCGGRDRFRVQPQKGRWLCRGCTDGKWQDVITYVMRREGLGFHEACKLLSPDLPGSLELPGRWRAKEPSVHIYTVSDEPVPAPPSVEWQNRALTLTVQAAQRLWEGADWLGAHFPPDGDTAAFWRAAPPAARAFHYLSRRGLRSDTMRAAMLGYNPDWHDGLAPGIVIPCVAGEWYDVWYVKVRTFRRRLDKYLFLKGSHAGVLYRSGNPCKTRPVVLVEGELDALLLQQEAGDLVQVFTAGSATVLPDDQWLFPLKMKFAQVYLCLDRDAAGRAGIARWQRVLPTARIMPPFPPVLGCSEPPGDITDFWRCGGNLRAWVKEALAP